ncbi:cytochrome P450 [Mycolicibacterium arabiense]|uniref:Steroid C26-monooxygenase n=1 Tax=Mycolicibacterium arabiense TaxID=1286181 RepID=A0A7I7S4E9_9MYCO|nr:cytochrome P450 [Mycolicibacterium arabiense]BBY51738.1 cytochrome P450 [Mycolicibacterium arabiense]
MEEVLKSIDVIPNSANPSPFWDQGIAARLSAFHARRDRSGGVEFVEPDDGTGFWSVTSYHSVRAVTRAPETFTSTQGFSMDDMPADVLQMLGSIIAMDAPKHQQYRRLVQVAFSPRAIRRMTDYVDDLATQIVDRLRDERHFDFVETVGAHLPFQVISDLLDIPQSDRPRLRELIDLILGVNDGDVSDATTSLNAVVEFFDYTMTLGEQRRRSPGDDITSTLMHSEVDGKRLSPQEFGSFVILLAAAGNDTTRTGLAWAMHLLSEHPDQKRALASRFEDLQANAIEEVLRWSSPVLHMRRTATTDTMLGPHEVRAGDKLVVWYLAANHDPAVFAEPDRFDIHRANARDHHAFGAGGPHYCLGANLARMEMRVVLGKLLAAFPDLHATAPPDLLRSTFVNGVKSMACTTA